MSAVIPSSPTPPCRIACLPTWRRFLRENHCPMRSGGLDGLTGPDRGINAGQIARISAWQGGKESLNNLFRTCWPLLARPCSLPKTRYTGDHSFQDIRMDCSKGTKAIVLGECEQGSFGSAG